MEKYQARKLIILATDIDGEICTRLRRGKPRRMARICKQYQDALRLHAAGRPIPRADLPDPPGFAPIPISDTPQVSAPAATPKGPAAASNAAVPAAVASSAGHSGGAAAAQA